MIEGGWLQVLQRIPADYYDTLSVVSVTGAELVIQQVFRVERDFMVVRARTAGTMDGGRVILVPYSQIDFLAFNRKMAEEEVGKIFNAPFQAFGSGAPVMMPPDGATGFSAPSTPLPDLPPLPLVDAQVPAATAPSEEEAPTSPQPQRPAQISKTVLLARLRERLAEKAK